MGVYSVNFINFFDTSMAAKYEWYSRTRNFKAEKNLTSLCPTFAHPLRTTVALVNATNAPRSLSREESSISSSTMSLNKSDDLMKNSKIVKENKFIDPLG